MEASNRLGGRACSFREKTTGALVDNCQHVILGCCRAAIDFFTKIGSIGLVEFSEAVDFVGSDGRRLRIRASRLPAPLHLLPSVMRGGYLPLVERLRLTAVMARVAARPPARGESAGSYLRSLGCSDELMRAVFEPILTAAVNEATDEASAECARMVIVKSLMEGRDGYRVGVPRSPLSELIAVPAARYLCDRGGVVKTGARVERLEFGGREVQSLCLTSGERIRPDLCVTAVPPLALDAMGFETEASGDLVWKPIVSAHLFFKEEVANLDHACVVGEPFGWVFNKSRDVGLSGGYLQAVGSAAANLARLKKSDLVYLALRSAARAAPEVEKAFLAHALILRQASATFSTSPPSTAMRPPATTEHANLFLAGDWTATGWPATIESAVRSGNAAAEAVIARVAGESARLEVRTA